MSWIVRNLWLIPVLPALAAGLSALARQRNRRFAASLAIGSMGSPFFCPSARWSVRSSIRWRGTGDEAGLQFPMAPVWGEWLKLGWMLDPLTAVMLVMVTFVGLLIFIYSTAYMAHDENFTRFFCFLSLFAAAMLGVVIANSLLLLFMCWELVGLTSYLLIGFWYQKPSAAAAAKKAFITTRIGDLAFLLGMVWLYLTGRYAAFLRSWRWLPGTFVPYTFSCADYIVWNGSVHRYLAADLCRCGWQVRPGAAACLVAGCNGRTDAGQRPDSRSDHGGGRCVSGCTRLSANVSARCKSHASIDRAT